jgi:heat shock protein HtpX
MSALVIGLGALVAPGFLYVFGAIALAMNLGAYYFSDRIVLRMQSARELPEDEAPWLHEMVEDMSREAAIPKPRLYLIPSEQPNAFATGRNPAHGVVAVTDGIMHALSRRELRGVIAHELAHIKNRDILIASVAAAAASIITWIANALSFGALFGGGEGEEGDEGGAGGGLLLAIVAPIAATLVQLGISRSREFTADETGARIAGDPEALAQALLTLERGVARAPSHESPAAASLFIVSPLAGGQGVASLFSTHPPTQARVERLMALSRDAEAGRIRPFGARPGLSVG